MAGVTIAQLVEKWRSTIAPEIPLPVLLAFIYYESGGNFSDATHGSPKNNPPYTRPAFYELGLFQTPAGDHGECPDHKFENCHFQPPGHDPKHSSPWFRWCCEKKSPCSANCLEIVAGSPQNWTDPETQVRVGLHDLKGEADRIRLAYKDLFLKLGSDWDLRVAVLLRFAGGGGFVRGLMNRYRASLAALPEDRRWEFLIGKLNAAKKDNRAANVDEKMSLAAKLGYRPL
jgi:hypothetical protein